MSAYDVIRRLGLDESQAHALEGAGHVTARQLKKLASSKDEVSGLQV
jgi:hypothetical protein